MIFIEIEKSKEALVNCAVSAENTRSCKLRPNLYRTTTVRRERIKRYELIYVSPLLYGFSYETATLIADIVK